MTEKARPKIYPMPIAAIYDDPRYLELPAAAAGMLFRLVIHFWMTQCHPLPVADHELKSIARAHAPTWRHWRKQVLEIFETAKPELLRYYNWRKLNKKVIEEAAQRGSHISQARKKFKKFVIDPSASYDPSALAAPRKLAQPSAPNMSFNPDLMGPKDKAPTKKLMTDRVKR